MRHSEAGMMPQLLMSVGPVFYGLFFQEITRVPE